MKSGLGHQSEEQNAKDGSMAIFCPACLQPGLNLPDNWKDKYPSYVCISGPEHTITHTHKGISSSELSSWMVTSLLNICGIGPVIRMCPYPLVWHSWQTQTCTSPISEAELRWLRQVDIISLMVLATNHAIAQYMQYIQGYRESKL
jgi:hypothetical protein